jgi:hypothetical protein
MTDDLRTRLEAVERAVAGGETDLAHVADAAALEERVTTVEERLDALETRLDGLDATTQAVRGYLGGVDDVTADVERQASLALAKAERVESRVSDTDEGLSVERLPAASTDRQVADGAHDTRSDARPGRPERVSATPDGAGRPSPPDAADGSRGTDHGPEESLVARLRDAL